LATINHKIDIPEHAIRCEQTRQLFAAMPLATLGTVVNAIILVAVQWPVIDHAILQWWLAVLLIITLWRSYLMVAFRKADPENHHCMRWNLSFTVGTILSACSWGAATILLFPAGEIVNQVFLAFVIGGMCAGAVTTLAFLPIPIFCFLSFTLIPLAWNFFSSGSPMALPMGTMVSLFLVLTSTSAWRIYQNTRNNITLRMEAAGRERAQRESEERFRLIFESAPLGIMYFDQQGVILNCNSLFTEMTGIQQQQAIGGNLLNTVKDEAARKAINAALAGEAGTFQGSSQVFFPNKDTPIRAYFRGIQMLDNSIDGGVALVEDITEDKRVERLKSEFVSTVSHELRTPLTAIIGSLGLLRSGSLSEQPENAQKLLDNAHRNSERLLLLINDLLDMEKIEAGKMEYSFEVIELMPFLEQAIQSNMSYGEQHRVRFKLDSRADGVKINADKHRLMQVMSNLMSNAVKFSPPDTQVEIGAHQPNDHMVRIYVTDHGSGVPESFQSRVFEKFSQSDSTDVRQVGGTGLGLSISKAIIEEHDGQIGFETKEGEGSTFYIDLPQDRGMSPSI